MALGPREPGGAGSASRDPDRWVQRLSVGHARRDETVARLHALLVRVARHELARRRGQLPALTGPEVDDLAHQAADDALVTILSKLDAFEGRSRFTTWAYTFVVFEVSSKVARHRWQRQPPSDDAFTFERLPDHLRPRPEDRLEQREQLDALARAIGELTERQREVFVAIALNGIPSDVVAIRFGCNRGAIYKNLFDARRNLRASLARAGHPVIAEPSAPEPS